MSFLQIALSDFLDRLASSAPTPGGGTAAALSGAMGASLVSMVAQLSIGKKGYESVHDEMSAVAEKSERLRAQLSSLMDSDSSAYERVLDAIRLGHETEDKKAKRISATQEALKRASQVPFEVAGACARVLELARVAAEKGNRNAASDAGVAALLAEAGMRAAILNIEANLKAINDETFVREMRDQVTHLADRRAELLPILRIVETRL